MTAMRIVIAVFYDNPNKVISDSLRSIAGYITDSVLPGVTPPYKTDVFERHAPLPACFPSSPSCRSSRCNL